MSIPITCNRKPDPAVTLGPVTFDNKFAKFTYDIGVERDAYVANRIYTCSLSAVDTIWANTINADTINADTIITNSLSAEDANITNILSKNIITDSLTVSSLNIVGETDEPPAGLMPTGAIVMWTGTTPPQGWYLCDGTQQGPTNFQTPDLRGRFVVGYHPGDTDYNALGKTGGSKTVTLNTSQIPSHSHSGNTGNGGSSNPQVSTGTGGGHSHTIRNVYPHKTATSRGRDFEATIVFGPEATTRTNGAHSHTFNVPIPNHQHPFTTNNTGGGQSHANRPPYYTLAYIIFLGI